MNNQILLSKRLSEIASFVEPGLVLADIGTDHGFLPISLVQSGQTPEAYACDVRKGPLEQAQKNVAAAGLTGQIKVLLGDGFGALAPGDAEKLCASVHPGKRDDSGGFYLNLRFEDGALTVISAAAQNIFPPDRATEHAWDEWVQEFFRHHGLAFRER